MRKTEVKLLCYCSLVTTRCLALIFPLIIRSEKFFGELRDTFKKQHVFTIFIQETFSDCKFYRGSNGEITLDIRYTIPKVVKGKFFFFFFYCEYRTVAITITCEHLRTKPTILVLKYTASYVTNVWMYEDGKCIFEQCGRLSSRYDDQCRRKPTLLGRDVSRCSLRHVVNAVPPTIVCTSELYIRVCMYVCVCLVCGYAHTHCAQVIRAYWTRLDAHMTKWSSTRRGRAEKSRRTWLAGLIAKGKIFPGIPESRAEPILLIMVIPTTYMNSLQGDEEPHPRTSFMYIYIYRQN